MAYEPDHRDEPTIRFWVITLFPEVIEPYVSASIIGRAVGTNFIQVYVASPRSCATDKHKTVDDRPYGGGPGMVMRAEPILRTVEYVKRAISKYTNTKTLILLTSPGGKKLTNNYANDVISEYTDVAILCGRYEGIDARVAQILDAEAISIGDYVMTGGELAALTIIDVITRRIPGVLGKFESLEEERTSSHEMYTRPAILRWQGAEYEVPEVLQKGNHAEMEKWKLEGR